jgi:hypothetical protein
LKAVARCPIDVTSAELRRSDAVSHWARNAATCPADPGLRLGALDEARSDFGWPWLS